MLISIPRDSLKVTYRAGSKVYHPSDCRAAKRIQRPQVETRRAAEQMGLSPCRNCEHRKT
jgi:hypothetical protein